MIEIDTKVSLGKIEVSTTNHEGHSLEFWSKRCTEKICGISKDAAPHIRQQAQEYQLAIYNTILYYMKQSINSERCTMKNLLKKQGHEDLAKILKEFA
jgi:hypothetical protein|tara:strand:- start:357 stop:650 length:294 start_codon:yes stop_codon:yes gene_type:complete